MQPSGPQKGPSVAGGGAAGTKKVGSPIIAALRDGSKRQSQNPHVWPKDGHPFARELLLDRNYVWSRMMASVWPGEAL